MLRLEPRLSAPGAAEWLARLAGGVVLALLAGVIVLALAGHDPLTAYGALLRGAFGSTRALAATINKAVPIGLCALGIALAHRAGLWNIGAEGQLYFGACRRPRPPASRCLWSSARACWRAAPGRRWRRCPAPISA
jgi:general nucleoside transport system permease protein